MQQQLFSTAEVAAKLGVSMGRVSHLTTHRGIKPVVMAGRRFYTNEDVTKMRPGRNGRPRLSKKARRSE